MPNIPYFSLSKHSFEKNSGYKSTVHALAEIIDNSVEADATEVGVVLMIDRESHLLKIGVADNGLGMKPETLQRAICEKSGEHLDRQSLSASAGRRKFGKYGVGLPKASISQCNKFTVWSWTAGGPDYAFRNGIDIEDEFWIGAGAQVGQSVNEAAPKKWMASAALKPIDHGTFVLWEHLDGLTWARARWGETSGLIPNLEFNVGRTYRYLLMGEEPELRITIRVIDEAFRRVESPVQLTPNDPLYCIPQSKVPREPLEDGTSWPRGNPLFDDLTGSHNYLEVMVPNKSSKPHKVRVTWKRSAAFKETFAQLGNRNAGSLPHGKHAAKNVGLSLLREGREVDMSQVLSNPSEPRERWFGVEFDFPHELDTILGMTNNKQSYTRLEQVLKSGFMDYKAADETTQECIERIEREDSQLAVCLRIAWKIDEIWRDTLRAHLNMRPLVVGVPGLDVDKDKAPTTAEEAAEEVATSADEPDDAKKEKTDAELEQLRRRVIDELVKDNVPEIEAEQIAERVVDRGFTYAIVNKRGLGSPFFNIGSVVDAKLIELNEDHAVHPYLLSSIRDNVTEDVDALRERLRQSRIALFLMLEAWAKIEADVRGKDSKEHRLFQRMREDWGRSLSTFVEQMEAHVNKKAP